MRLVLSVSLILLCCNGAAVADPQITQALNSLRAESGRAPLRYSEILERAAARHANDMAQNSVFSHTGSDGSNVSSRVGDTGYGWCVVAENIARGQRDLEEVMQAWDASPGHRKNMMSREVSEFALVQRDDFVWVMVLAAPGC